ncbi:MAG: hypothetical protein LBE14_08810 [Treponema sp.]|jgi:hypothetical protein|nr:hypothetical protein [Treponema sp.]
MSNLIVMAWLLSLGFVPNSALKASGNSIEASNCLTQTLGVGFYLLDCVHIYSTVEIRETKSHNIYFDPFRGDFLIGGSFYFENFSIGLSHECNHDIITNTDLNKYNGWEAAFEKAYISYTIPLHVHSGMTITPSITLADQFTEQIRIKNNNEKSYFTYIPVDISPNIFFAEIRLEMEFFYLRSRVAFQAGYTTHNTKWAYTQFNVGAEIFYNNISLGLDYIKRENKQKNAGYSLEGLALFIRFRGKASLL